MQGSILTNEWTHVKDGYPFEGRVVLVIVERTTRRGNSVIYHDTAVWNGVNWLDEKTMETKILQPGETITHWYIFDKFNPIHDD